jgi:hypothetical protein
MIDSLPQARRAIGRAHPRDPSDIDGLTVWLQADRGVVLDASGNVSEWRDQSGRGNHAVQSTAGARPTYARDANGRRVVQTTRAARFMTIPATADTGPTAAGFTVYAAVSSSDAVNFGSVAGKWSAVAADESWISMTNDATAAACSGYFSEAGTNTDRGAFSPGDASTGVPRVTALRYDPTGFVRNSLDGTTAAGGAIAGVKNVPTGIAYIGRSTPTLYPLDASISTIIIVQRYIAGGSAEDVFIRDYFRRTCGTP